MPIARAPDVRGLTKTSFGIFVRSIRTEFQGDLYFKGRQGCEKARFEFWKISLVFRK